MKKYKREKELERRWVEREWERVREREREERESFNLNLFLFYNGYNLAGCLFSFGR